jgi:hypothetical protein
MDVAALLVELYGRVPPLAEQAVDGLDVDTLTRPPWPGANTIAWLVWHVARVQDHHLAELLSADQLWTEGPWPDSFGLDPDPANNGYGHSLEDVLAVRPTGADALTDYLGAVSRRTQVLLEAIGPEDLDRVVDRRWDPAVTMGVRLVSIADDNLQHAGQANYVRGLFAV